MKHYRQGSLRRNVDSPKLPKSAVETFAFQHSTKNSFMPTGLRTVIKNLVDKFFFWRKLILKNKGVSSVSEIGDGPEKFRQQLQSLIYLSNQTHICLHLQVWSHQQGSQLKTFILRITVGWKIVDWVPCIRFFLFQVFQKLLSILDYIDVQTHT